MSQRSGQNYEQNIRRIAEYQRCLAEALQRAAKPGRFGRIQFEVAVHDGELQEGKLTTADSIKVG